jgi:hypothetical protein
MVHTLVKSPVGLQPIRRFHFRSIPRPGTSFFQQSFLDFIVAFGVTQVKSRRLLAAAADARGQ